jgi:hypothetical protein
VLFAIPPLAGELAAIGVCSLRTVLGDLNCDIFADGAGKRSVPALAGWMFTKSRTDLKIGPSRVGIDRTGGATLSILKRTMKHDTYIVNVMHPPVCLLKLIKWVDSVVRVRVIMTGLCAIKTPPYPGGLVSWNVNGYIELTWQGGRLPDGHSRHQPGAQTRK